MCRFTLFKGKAILLGDLLVFPDNSLVSQSREASYHPGVIDDFKHKRNILVNGDGFGVAWYGASAAKGACALKFVTPAWGDTNLRSIGAHVESSLIMAHIRAASSGHDMFEDAVVSTENCHPFRFGPWTFMHNGSLPHFKVMKRALLNILKDDVFHGITGTTDSEHIFALFLNTLNDPKKAATIPVFIAAVEQTMSTLLDLCVKSSIKEPCSLNLVISDGITVIATRFRSGIEAPPSLYYNWGSDFGCTDGHFVGKRGVQPKEIVISSAPLSRESNSCVDLVSDSIGQWILMPRDHMLVVCGDPNGQDISVVHDVYLRPLNLTFDYDNFRLVNCGPAAAAAAATAVSVPLRPSSPPLWSEWRDCSSGPSNLPESPTKASMCNRLRVVGSRTTTPRGSLCEADAPPAQWRSEKTTSSSSSSSGASSSGGSSQGFYICLIMTSVFALLGLAGLETPP